MTLGVRAARGLLVIALLTVWWLHLLHAPISDVVGAHFPFPRKGSPFVWPAVLVEAALIEGLVCLPVAALLVVALHRQALATALGLVCIFALRVAVEVFDRDQSRNLRTLGMAQVAAEALFLVGGVVVFAKALARRRARHGRRPGVKGSP